MDVLLIDDKDGEALLVHEQWDPRGIRVLHSDDLDDVRVAMAGERPDGWPDPPYDPVIAVIDVDLGDKGPGPAGGIVATDLVARWARRAGHAVPVLLRTESVDDDRSLAAVLAAELAGAPLPLWGKQRVDTAAMAAFVVASQTGSPDPTAYGARRVHPVRFVRDERGERDLGRFLHKGARGSVWSLIHDGLDPDAAVLAAGMSNANKFWEPLNALIAAIVHLRENERPLHTLEGRPVRVTDVEREIYAESVEDLEVAMYAVSRMPDTTEDARARVMRSLEKARQEVVDWLGGDRDRRPSQNRNRDQGEFLGAYGRVLGHPEVVELFSR